MNKIIRLILAETNRHDIKNIEHDERKDCWTICYKDGSEEDCSSFYNVMEVLNREI